MKVSIIFRKFKGEVLALFPNSIENYKGDVSCYSHIGQHAAADYDYVIKNSKPIKEPKNIPLYLELINIGYKLRIIKRRIK